jgi:hypothetical protein
MTNTLATYGYTEATLAPSRHQCSDNLVDAVIEPPSIVLICYTCREWWRTGLVETGGYKSLTSVIRAADKRYPKRKKRHMSQTTLNQPVEFCTIVDIIARGGEVKIVLNGHQFTLVQDGMFAVASVDGEQCKFVGMSENEIKNELLHWSPGLWR